MNENMDAKDPRTESPAGGMTGADHVYNVFRRFDHPLTKQIWISVIMLIVFCVGVVFVIPPLLVLIALPFFPGGIVRRELIDDVIPSCRHVCSEKEIVSGALKCLRYLWGRYLLGLFPGIMIVLGLAVCYFSSKMGSKPFRELGWPIVLSFAVILLGECALAVFPVARLFSRRAGMIIMLILIILGHAVLLANTVLGASGIIWFTDGDPHVKEYTVFTFRLIFVCTVVFGGGLGYFLHAAYTDAENEGLLY